MRTLLRRVGKGLGWLAVLLLCLVASVAYHLDLPRTRQIVRDAVNRWVSGEIRGELRIGEIESLGPWQVVATGVEVRDPEGRTVIRAPRVRAWPDPRALLTEGRVHVFAGHIDEPEVVLHLVTEDGGPTVSLVTAFLPAHPGPPDPEGLASPIPVHIDGLRIREGLLHGDMPGLSGLRVESLDVLGQMEVDRSVVFHVRQASGRWTAPYPGTIVAERIVLDFDVSSRVGLDAYARLRRGDDVATVDATIRRPEGAAAQELDLAAHVESLRLETLSELGVPGTALLSGPVHGELRLRGPFADLALDAEVVHASGPVRLRGRIAQEGETFLEAEAQDFALQGLVPRAPPVEIGGTFRIGSRRDGAPGTVVAARALPLRIGGVAVPGIEAEGRLGEDGLVLERLRAPHLGGAIDAEGRIGFDGSLDVRTELDVQDVGDDPNVARLVPGAHGAVQGRLHVSADAGGEDLDFDGHLVFLHFRYGPFRADRLEVDGRARHGTPTPIAHADLRGRGVSLGGLALGSAEARIDGGPRSYRGTWRSRGADVPRLGLTVQAEHRRGAWALEAPAVELDLGTGAMHGTLGGVEVAPGQTRIGSLVLEGEGQRIAGSAELRSRGGDSRADVEVAGLELERIDRLTGGRLAGLRGRADARMSLRGPLADPAITLAGTVHALGAGALRDGELTYALEHRDGTLRTEATLDLGRRGTLELTGPIEVPLPALLDDPRHAIEGARFELHAYASRLGLGQVLPLLGERATALGVGGQVSGDLAIEGTLADPRIDPGILILDQLVLPGMTGVRAKVHFSLVGPHLRVEQLWLADAEGELAIAEGELELPLGDPPEDAAGWLRGIHARPFRLAVRLEPRRLDGWPRPLAKFLPRGVTATAELTLSGGDGHPARGDLFGTLRWVEAAVPAPCAARLRPFAQIRGSLAEERTRVLVTAFAEGRAALSAHFEAPTPIDAWMQGAGASLPDPEILAHVQDAHLEDIPWTCGRAEGRLDADLRLEHALEAPAGEGHLEIRQLRLVGEEQGLYATRPYHVRAELALTGQGASGCATLASADAAETPFSECASAPLPGDGEVILRGRVPLRRSAGTLLPELDPQGAVDLRMLVAEAHLEPLLSLLPDIADADVIADGRLEAHGSPGALELAGGLSLRDGRARIASMGQHLTELGGTVQLTGNRIVVVAGDPLRARDGDGAVEISGEIGLRGFEPTHLYLTIEPEELPVRREGSVLATISGALEVRTSIGLDGTEGTVALDRFTVRLPEQTAGSVQSLEPRLDVAVVGADAPRLGATVQSDYPIHLRVDGTTPFWVRRNDFAALVRSELDVTYDSPDLFVGGYVEIVRGYFEVFGKRFEVQRGSLTFTGGSTLAPLVDLVATYPLPGRPGATVTVRASGTLGGEDPAADPLHVDFTSTETSDQGEIIALLVSGRRAIGASDPTQTAQAASTQAASFLAGLSAGILTLGLRQQFGDLVPLIAIETGQNLGDTIIRAGFNAEAAIPDVARDVVLGAYVEGFVSTTTGRSVGGGSGGVGGGVTLELEFPYNLVGSGTYVPPTSWGLDLTWQP